MLVKVKDGSAMRMAHEGKWYLFAKGEVKDCPDSFLPAFRGFVVSAELVSQPRQQLQPIVAVLPKEPSTMPVIQSEQPKIKIPTKIKIKKKTK